MKHCRFVIHVCVLQHDVKRLNAHFHERLHHATPQFGAVPLLNGFEIIEYWIHRGGLSFIPHTRQIHVRENHLPHEIHLNNILMLMWSNINCVIYWNNICWLTNVINRLQSLSSNIFMSWWLLCDIDGVKQHHDDFCVILMLLNNIFIIDYLERRHIFIFKKHNSIYNLLKYHIHVIITLRTYPCSSPSYLGWIIFHDIYTGSRVTHVSEVCTHKCVYGSVWFTSSMCHIVDPCVMSHMWRNRVI